MDGRVNRCTYGWIYANKIKRKKEKRMDGIFKASSNVTYERKVRNILQENAKPWSALAVEYLLESTKD